MPATSEYKPQERPVIIAIDGPAASGKSTVARKVAAALEYLYVDSGALYRGVTWLALRKRVDPSGAEAVIAMLAATAWEFHVRHGAVVYTLDGEDPSDEIRSGEVNENVSFIARLPEVRTMVVEQLREMATLGSLVIEGRDIGSVVFPETPYKFYLDADPEERARRRSLEAGDDVEATQASLARRDKLDSSRKTAPLQIALGAKVVDTTSLEIDEVAEHVLDEFRENQAKQANG